MSRIITSCLLSTAALLIGAPASHADTIKVPKDHATITEAIAAANPGDVINVAKGTYTELVVLDKADITLKGSSAIINGDYLGTCLTVSAAGAIVSGFTLANGGLAEVVDGTSTGGLHVTAPGSGADISSMTIKNCDDFGIWLEGSGTIENCKLDGVDGTGLLVQTGNAASTTVTTIKKNTITRSGEGMFLTAGPFLLESNTVRLNAAGGITLSILPAAVEGGGITVPTEVVKNKIEDNGGVGLFADVSGAGAVATLLEKNTCTGNELGMFLIGSGLDVLSNTLSSNREGGLLAFVAASTLEKNKVQGNGAGGIMLDGFAPPVEGGATNGSNHVASNTLQDNAGDGIQVRSLDNMLEKNTVKDNGGDGIDINVGADGCILDGNKISNNDHDGIDNSGLLTSMVKNNTKGNGGADLAGAGDGLGTADPGSADNVIGDQDDDDVLTGLGELEMDSDFFAP